MQSRAFITFAIAPAIAALPAGLLAQDVPVRTFGRPDVEFSEPFSGLIGIRELSDGRVIVTDRTEKAIVLLDLARGSMTRIGREGSGPGEYTMPMAVVGLPGDTSLVSDLSGKYIKIAPNGTIVGDVSPQQGLTTSIGGGRMMMVRPSLSGNADAAGRLYSQGTQMRQQGDQFVQADSVPITRHDLRTGRTDTVTWFPVPPMEIRQAGTPGGGSVSFSMRVGGASQPFIAQRVWTVAADGRIAILSPDPYQVTWVSPSGRKTPGQPIQYERIRVTEAEKNAYRERQQSSPREGISMRMGGGGQTSVSTSQIPFQEPESWPEFKHPYPPGVNSVSVAPTGELWVLKQQAASARNPTFDVIGSRGEVTARVVLPERTTLLGFGANGTVYLIRRDDDDLQYLQRYRLNTAR